MEVLYDPVKALYPESESASIRAKGLKMFVLGATNLNSLERHS